MRALLITVGSRGDAEPFQVVGLEGGDVWRVKDLACRVRASHSFARVVFGIFCA